MSDISPQTLLASHSSLSSLTPTDIQDTQSSHSEIQQPQHQSTQQQTSKTSEYKSNFTPFDQYVYNEITDSFVKQKSPTANSHLLIEPSSATGGSNQDLNALSSISPALEVTSFEPNNRGPDQHYDVTKEPWYKEVVRRNEKANEYRFKSEVGHSSPLLKQADDNNITSSVGLSNDELSTVALVDEQHHASSCSVISPAPTNSDELSSRRAYNFTHHDYKRDHLIATMANNNNFKPLKEDHSQQHQERATGARRVQASGRPARPATSSARPLARTTAASRARSQTSRTAGSSKAEPVSKSNQSSPVKNTASRALTTRTTLASARSAAAKSTNGTATNAGQTPARPSAAGSSGSFTRTSVAPARRVPLASATPASRPTTAASKTTADSKTTSTARSGTTTSSSRPSIARGSALNTASRSTATRTPSSSTTGTITITKAARASPVKRPTTQTPATKTTTRPTTAAPARNSLSRAPASRSGSTTGGTISSSTASNEPKSIKSKALADAGEKAAALAAAAALPTTNLSSSQEAPGEQANTVADKQQDSTVNLVEMTSQLADTQPNANYYLDQEQNLIITTTETGNMLADEIACAERAAREEALRAQQELANPHPTLTYASSEPHTAAERESTNSCTQKSQKDNVVEGQTDAKSYGDSMSEELVNGLSGGIVSAEDTYDFTERESSSGFASQKVSQSANDQQEHREDDDDQEPYSLMPTTFNAARQEEPQEATQQYFNEAFEDEDNPTNYGEPEDKFSNDINESRDVQYLEPTETKKSDDSRHVEFDMNVRTKSAESIHETEIVGSRSIAKLEFSQPLEDEDQQQALTTEDAAQRLSTATEDSASTLMAEPLTNDLTYEPYEHLEPESDLVLQPGGEELRTSNQSIEENSMTGRDSRIEDEFEVIEKEREKGKEQSEREDDSTSQVGAAPVDLVSERDDLVVDEMKKLEPVQGQKSEGSGAEELQDEEKNDSEVTTQDKPDLPGAEKSLLNKTIDSHKLTEDIELINESAEQVHGIKLDEGADTPSVFVPQLDDLDDTSAEQRQSIDVDDLQASQSSQSSSSRSEAIPIDRADEEELVDLVNKPTESLEDQEENEVQFHENETNPSAIRNELLMNVADLVETETRAKEEMTRKSEAARQQSNSRCSLTFSQTGEILLSADQLNEQFVQSAGEMRSPVEATESEKEEEREQLTGDDAKKDAIVFADHEVSNDSVPASQEHQYEQQVDLDAAQTRLIASTHEDAERDQEILSAYKLASLEQQRENQSADDLVNFGSITSTQERPPHDQDQPDVADERDLMSGDTNEQQQQPRLVDRESSTILETSSTTDLMGGSSNDNSNCDERQACSTDHLNKSNNLLYDDLMDDDEQQKLSNHLTNSDDDVILAPRNTKETLLDDCFGPQKVTSGSRYNEGAGLSSMAQQEEELFDGSTLATGLADGSSAAIETPTAAENRVELATSKSLMPELHAVSSTGFVPKLSGHRSGFASDDDEQDPGLDLNADPIDVAATLSPSSSVLGEMLHSSRQASDASMTGGAVSKLAEELRSDGLASESFEKDADTYISGGSVTSAALVDTRFIASSNQTRDQVFELPNEPTLNLNPINNNNNELERAKTSEETDASTGDLVQRKASSDLGEGSGGRKESEPADRQHQASSAGGGELNELVAAVSGAVPTN